MAKYLIVGGVAGGATTAARLRRLDENAEIIIFERGEHISYANCGLPYYIGGVITDRSRLLLQTPESFNARFRVDVRIRTEVVGIQPEKKTVLVKDLNSGDTSEENYDQLILSPGAKPVVPPIEGIKSQKIFTLRNVDDTDRIKNFIDAKTPKRAVVIGAGFIGVEMAENLHHRNVETTVVEAGDQILNPLDFEMASILHNHFKEQNVGLVLNNPVKRFEELDDGMIVHLNNGDKIEADIVMLSIGVKPDVQLAKDAGLRLGKFGGILVDKYLQTSAESIYAVGDGIEFQHAVSGEVGLSLLAGPANKQGRLLADNLILGRKRTWKGSIQTAIAKVFSLTAATTGLNEKTLKRLGKQYHSTVISGGSHAGYYPDSTPMNLKLTFDNEGKIYGAQVVGIHGVDKRIDMIASIMQSGGTIYDLMEIEHAYAPPFSSAKDPVNQLGFNAENILNGLLRPITYSEMQDADRNQVTILDVRTAEEYALGNIIGSMNIPVDNLRDNLELIPNNKKVYVYCAVGLRGYVASRILMQKGYEVYNLSGGYKLYAQAIAEQSHLVFTQQSNHINTTKAPIEKDMKNLDCKGLQCPGPIIKLKEAFDEMNSGESLRVSASDAGFYKDVESWCHVTGNVLVDRKQESGIIEAVIMKGNGEQCPIQSYDRGDNKTIICFSDDMDKALATFVIANGAASMGKKVTIFFTFWGLNVIKRHDKPKVKKDFMGTMFSKMMPGHASKLSLSNMNMGGMGSKMMKIRMAQKNVDMLEQMIAQTVKGNVQLIACQMSMDIMGVDKAEFIDGVHIGGVANYLEEAEQANVNLFI